MNDEREAELIKELTSAEEQVKTLGTNVANLKKSKAPANEITAGVEALNAAKARVNTIRKELCPPEKLEVSRDLVENLLTRRFFIAPSFSIYGGVKGFYDFGPPGCAVKANLLNFWRQFFILEENMLEIDTATITPEPVFIASGHVAKFCDLMVKDLTTGAYHRADHLLEDFMDGLLSAAGLASDKRTEYENVRKLADDYSQDDLTAVLRKYNVLSPDGNPISDAIPANLMFETSVGRGGGPSYLRPETAQGIFVNFAKLLEFNGGKIPFAGATIGLAYRNEIAPRSGLLRVREFTLAEIEHFVDPDDKSHPKFSLVANTVINLFSQSRQDRPIPRPLTITIGEALEQGIIKNETMGYFIARVQLFLIAIGIKPDFLRFRQHRAGEMAHYAQDCWDGEILTTYGWVECIGIADRACYDLSQHVKGSGARLSVFKKLDKPYEVEETTLTPNKGVICKKYTKVSQPLLSHLSSVSAETIDKIQADITANGKHEIQIESNSYEIDASMVKFAKTKKKVLGENIVPSVIEPSFGIGRIMYSLLEHSFYSRAGDANRNVLALSAIIAPVKCSVLPLQQNKKFTPIVHQVSTALTAAAISNKVDDVGQSIGKRYARTDEIGIPFGITVDFTTVEEFEANNPNPTVTLRERDSIEQIRIPINEVVTLLSKLVNGHGGATWAEEKKKYPVHVSEPEKEK